MRPEPKALRRYRRRVRSNQPDRARLRDEASALRASRHPRLQEAGATVLPDVAGRRLLRRGRDDDHRGGRDDHDLFGDDHDHRFLYGQGYQLSRVERVLLHDLSGRVLPLPGGRCLVQSKRAVLLRLLRWYARRLRLLRRGVPVPFRDGVVLLGGLQERSLLRHGRRRLHRRRRLLRRPVRERALHLHRRRGRLHGRRRMLLESLRRRPALFLQAGWGAVHRRRELLQRVRVHARHVSAVILPASPREACRPGSYLGTTPDSAPRSSHRFKSGVSVRVAAAS
jgi:hypothetical protein